MFVFGSVQFQVDLKKKDSRMQFRELSFTIGQQEGLLYWIQFWIFINSNVNHQSFNIINQSRYLQGCEILVKDLFASIQAITFANMSVADDAVFVSDLGVVTSFYLSPLQKNDFSRQVGQKGSQISDSQKQRIAIARDILRNPNFLLLDEPISANCAKSEQIVSDIFKILLKIKLLLIEFQLLNIQMSFMYLKMAKLLSRETIKHIQSYISFCYV